MHIKLDVIWAGITTRITGDGSLSERIHVAAAIGGQGAMPLSQLFEVLFDSSVVVKYPIF